MKECWEAPGSPWSEAWTSPASGPRGCVLCGALQSFAQRRSHGMLFRRRMAQRISLPRICIALGFPDTETLLAHARKEYEAGERFLEFRIDYLPSPENGVAAVRN